MLFRTRTVTCSLHHVSQHVPQGEPILMACGSGRRAGRLGHPVHALMPALPAAMVHELPASWSSPAPENSYAVHMRHMGLCESAACHGVAGCFAALYSADGVSRYCSFKYDTERCMGGGISPTLMKSVLSGGLAFPGELGQLLDRGSAP